jgi:hypothetical protein
MVCLTAWQQLRLLLAYGCPPHVGDCDGPSDLIDPSNPFDREKKGFTTISISLSD